MHLLEIVINYLIVQLSRCIRIPAGFITVWNRNFIWGVCQPLL